MSALKLLDQLINVVDSTHSTQFKNMFTCQGMDELNLKLSDINTERIFLIFYGSLIDNKSWCPDSVKAKPFIDENIKYLNNKRDSLIIVYVGQKPEWKDKSNIFRKDERFKLVGVPTLLQYKTNKRLVVEECWNSYAITQMFTD